MRRSVKSASLLLAVLLSAVLCLESFYELSKAGPLENRISYLWESPAVMPVPDKVYQMHQGGLPVRALWWTPVGKGEIESGQLRRKVQVPVLALCGSSALLFPAAAVLEYKDTGRCLLGRETAARLFGDDRAEGLRVSFAGREYEVAGVLQDVRELFVYELAAEEKLPLQRLTVECDDHAGKAMARNQAEGLCGPESLLDFDLLYFLGQLVSLIVPGCFLWVVLAAVRRSEMNRSVRLALFWGLLLLFLALSMRWLKVPVDFIPVRWSDFEFWRTLFHEKQNCLRRFFTTALAPPDMLWIVPLLRAALLEAGAAVCFAFACGGLSRPGGKGWENGKDRVKECIKDLWNKYRGGKRGELNR